MADLTRQEIESHSSALTNIRISKIAAIVCTTEAEALNAIPPAVQHAIAYHSSLLTFYMETSEAYDTDVNKEIREELEKCVKDGEKVVFYLKYNPEAKQIAIEWLIQNSKKWRYLMHNGLQNLRYWFRFGKHDPKGIKDILKLFEQSKSTKEGKNEIPEHTGQLPDKTEKQPTVNV